MARDRPTGIGWVDRLPSEAARADALVPPPDRPAVELPELLEAPVGSSDEPSPAAPQRSLGHDSRLEAVMARLALRRPVFHSEGDFQHELATELSQIESIYARVDQPLQVGDERFKLDLIATVFRGRREQVGFELRYLTRPFGWTDPTTHESYTLRDTPPVQRLSFLLDIGRVERAVHLGEIDAGCAILLSNDPNAWAPKSLPRQDDWMRELESLFRDGGTIALEKLHSQSSDGFWWGLRVGGPALSQRWDEPTLAKDPAARHRAFEAFQRLPYIFEGEYPALWRRYSELSGSGRGTLRYLAVEIR